MVESFSSWLPNYKFQGAHILNEAVRSSTLFVALNSYSNFMVFRVWPTNEESKPVEAENYKVPYFTEIFYHEIHIIKYKRFYVWCERMIFAKLDSNDCICHDLFEDNARFNLYSYEWNRCEKLKPREQYF